MDRNLSLDVRLLGGFALRVGDQLVPATVWRQRRAAAIIKLLALEPGHRLHREQLLETLWPDRDPESAANNLRVALHHARQGLERAGAPAGVFLVRDGDSLVLGPHDAVQVDVTRFDQAVTRAWQHADPATAERAASFYQGDLLPEDPYEDWAAARREALRASYLTLLARLSGMYEVRGDFSRAMAAQERVLAADPLEETAHSSVMRLHAQMGNASLALAHYARFESVLEQELGAAPEPETRELAAAIREGRLTPAPPPPAPPLTDVRIAAASRLPAAVDIPVGRERELAELQRLLASSRLVTLTGPGGIGKTRLALETARVVEPRYPDGAALVDLAPLRDPTLVLPAVSRAIGVEESAGQPIGELLAASIGERHLLLILDNLEQVAEAGPGIAALMTACPNLTFLATSRVRLRVRGEQEYPVSPLPLPDLPTSGIAALMPDLARTPAVALFVRRAQAARPDFRLTPENVSAVAAVCHRLDGLPLAIELAAARVRVLTPDHLLRRMARPLDVLGMTAADVPARQRTLRDTIAWSHALLDPDEQMLFRRLSVFAGSWTLEGAEAVAASADEPAFDTVETLAGLIDHSLVNARHEGEKAEVEPRYTMLETIREFAIEQLAASGEIVPIERAFESFLLRLAGRAEAGMRGPDQLNWLERLEEEHDNVRAALGRMVDRGDGEAALSLAPRIAPFWRARGYAVEGRSWLERALELVDDPRPGPRAAALDALGGLAIDLGDYDAADRHYRESVDLWWKLGDRPALVQGLYDLSIARTNRGAFDEAQSLLEEALAIAREEHDERGMAATLHNLGMLARENGHLGRAIDLLEEAMAIWRQLGDPHWIGATASNLGDAHRLAGDAERARACFDESAALYSRLGDRFALGVIANHRGLLEQDAGHTAEAFRLHGEALHHFDAVRAPLGAIESIEWLAVSAAGAGQASSALRLFGAADAARKALGLTPLSIDAALVATGRDRAMRDAGSDAAEHLASGAALTLDQARDAALELAGPSR